MFRATLFRSLRLTQSSVMFQPMTEDTGSVSAVFDSVIDVEVLWIVLTLYDNRPRVTVNCKLVDSLKLYVFVGDDSFIPARVVGLLR